MPSAMMLRHTVVIERKSADGQGYGVGVEAKASVQQRGGRSSLALGLDPTTARTRVYFGSDQSLKPEDRILYTTASGERRFVSVEVYRDEAGMGRVFKAEGSDFPVDDEG